MGKFFAGFLGFFGNLFAASPSTCTLIMLNDEPQCPESLLD